jgi:hypothetical protein
MDAGIAKGRSLCQHALRRDAAQWGGAPDRLARAKSRAVSVSLMISKQRVGGCESASQGFIDVRIYEVHD